MAIATRSFLSYFQGLPDASGTLDADDKVLGEEDGTPVRATTAQLGAGGGGGGYTDEQAQDAVGAMVNSTLVYNDGTPSLGRAALTGDVTASAGSNATTIANDAVSNAKLANLATNRIKGRVTASSGDPEDLTPAQARTVIASDSGSATAYLDGTGNWSTPAGGGGGYAPGGTDVALADGGTGASLTDPNADRMMFWDDSAGAVTWLAPNNGLAVSGTNLNVDPATSAQVNTGSNNTNPLTPARAADSLARVYFHSAGSYSISGGRIFIGTEDPSADGFTPANGDIWMDTTP